MSTTVINILKDEYSEDDFVYIGRQNNRLGHAASKWANPFVEDQDGTRAEVIEKYRNWILTQPELMAALPELRGKVLGCYCKPKACHGEVLAAMVDSETTTVPPLQVHPVANIFPMMSAQEYEGLKEDIRLHGQREHITVWHGLLVDGRNRLRACKELGIEPEIGELMDETDPVQYALSQNLHRRHLSTAQRSMVGTKLATLRHGEKKTDSSIELSSQADAADKLNVSVASVKRAKTVATKATPEVIAAVERGELSLNAAVATTKPAKAKPAKPACSDSGKAAFEIEGRIYGVMSQLQPYLARMNFGPNSQPQINAALKDKGEPGRRLVDAMLIHMETVAAMAKQLAEILNSK